MSEPAGRPDISAVIVNYNGGPLLPACVRALRETADALCLEIVVVDNGSTDGSLDLLHGELVPDRLIRITQNLGFGRANNLGAQYARGRYYLLVNTDCFVRPGLPAALVERLDADPSIGMIGPRLLNADGTLQPSCHNFPTPLVLFLEQSLLWRLLRFLPAIRQRLAIAGEHTQPRAVDWLSGACLLVRAEAWRAAGGFDPGFFFYWEEADLARRMQEQGRRVVFEPEAEAVHLGGGSSGNPALLGQFFRSLYLFYAKHYPPRRLALARLIVGAMSLFKAARAGLGWLCMGGNPDRAVEARGWLRVSRL